MILLDQEEDSGFGAMPSKNNKNKGKQAQQAAQKAQPKVAPKKKTAEQIAGSEDAQKKKVSAAIKDITVVPDEDIVDVDETRTPASFVFIGHVDAGKSTICGNLIYSMGIVD